MDKYSQGRQDSQVRRVRQCRQQLLENRDLCMRELLPKEQVMQMDVLRCKSPAMVRKEIWMHLLAYNLVRTLMVRAALKAGVCPRDISFKGTLQTILAFAAAGWSCSGRRNELYTVVLRAVATHRVNDRPDRIEPRAVKRRPKKGRLLNEPRNIAKARLLNGT